MGLSLSILVKYKIQLSHIVITLPPLLISVSILWYRSC